MFFDMIGNYKDRMVGRNDYDWGFVSTCEVSDGERTYETAVKCILYKDESDSTENMCIVEAYYDKESAERGHKKWVKTMNAKSMPETLTDCLNSEISKMVSGEDGQVFTLLK